jgi:signal transduction histidine kinase
MMSPQYRTREIFIPWLALGLVLLIVGGFIVYIQYREHRHIKDWEEERLINQAKVVEKNLVRQLEGVRRALEGIRADIPHWQQKSEQWGRASQRLVAMSDAMPGVRTFIITDAKGTVIAANRAQLMGLNFRERAYFKVPHSRADPETLYVSPPFKTSFGVIAINVGRAIMDQNGRFTGVVSATLSPEYFSILLESILYAPDMRVTLSHGDGSRFLDLPLINAAIPGRHEAHADLFSRHRASGKSSTLMYDRGVFSDQDQIIAQRTMQPPDLHMDNPLVVAMARNMMEPYDEWRRDSFMIAIVFAVFAAALSTGLYLFLRSQRVLHGQERFLSTLSSVIPGLISYWNRSLCCVYANKQHSVWFGKAPDEMTGIHMKELLGDEPFTRDKPFISNVLAGKPVHFERVLTMSDVGERNVLVSYMPDCDGDQTQGFYVLVTDVTELKYAQRDLEKLNQELRRRIEEAELANKAKSRFLASVAHEFRTPLSLLTSSTDILDRYGDRLNAAESMLQRGHIRNAARQMSCLIDSVLTFNRLDMQIQHDIPVNLDICAFCRQLSDEVKSAWCDGHTFSVTIAETCGTSLLDEQLFRRLLENLLTNAFRYTPKGGNVSFRVDREGSRLQIEIRDSGIGIPEECREQIFEPFYRCGNVATRRGLGLGLSIVHEALSRLGGSITVDSAVGIGTTVQVDLPARNPADVEEPQACTQS